MTLLQAAVAFTARLKLCWLGPGWGRRWPVESRATPEFPVPLPPLEGVTTRESRVQMLDVVESVVWPGGHVHGHEHLLRAIRTDDRVTVLVR